MFCFPRLNSLLTSLPISGTNFEDLPAKLMTRWWFMVVSNIVFILSLIWGRLPVDKYFFRWVGTIMWMIMQVISLHELPIEMNLACFQGSTEQGISATSYHLESSGGSKQDSHGCRRVSGVVVELLVKNSRRPLALTS